MPAVYEPRHWPFGVPYMAALRSDDYDAFRTAWFQVLNDAPAGDSQGGSGADVSGGGGGEGVGLDPSQRLTVATSLYASQPDHLRAIFTRVRLPLAPLSAVAGTAGHRDLDRWMSAVVTSRVTFTGEHQTPGKLMFDEALQIVMRLRSAVVLHAHGLRVPEAVQHEIIDECGTRPPPSSSAHDDDDSHRQLHQHQRTGRRQSLSIRNGARRLSLMPAARHSRTHSHRSGSDSANAGHPCASTGCLPHPVHDIAARPEYWLGPAEMLSGRPSQLSTLEAFTAAGGAPDGTGSISLRRVARYLQGTCIDIANAFGGRLAKQQQLAPGHVDSDEDDAGGNDPHDSNGGQHDRVTLAELAAMMFNDDDDSDAASGDEAGGKSAKSMRRPGTLGFTPSDSTRPGAGAGPDGSTANGAGGAGAAGVAGDGHARPDYRLTASGKFVLQPWVKRPAHVTNARLERTHGGPAAGGGGDGSGGSARPVGGLSRRQRRSAAAAATATSSANGAVDLHRQQQQRDSGTTHPRRSGATAAADASAVRVTGATAGRGLAALRAAMLAGEQRGREVTLRDVVRVASTHDDDRAFHHHHGGGGGGALAPYDADLPALEEPTTGPGHAHTDGAAAVDGEDSCGREGARGPRSAEPSSSDDESEAEVAARYRTLQLPHIYGGPQGMQRGQPPPPSPPPPMRAATSLEVRGRYSTAAANTRKVDPNRAAALERARQMQLAAESQAEAMERERRRRMAAGLSDDHAHRAPLVGGGGGRGHSAVTPGLTGVQRKRPASKEGTLRLAARLLANFESSPSRQSAAAGSSSGNTNGGHQRRPPVHMTNAAFRAASVEADPFGGGGGGVDNGSFVGVHRIGRSQRIRRA